MSTKSMDIVKPPATTELQQYLRWRNRLQSELAQLNRYRIKIEVRYEQT